MLDGVENFGGLRVFVFTDSGQCADVVKLGRLSYSIRLHQYGDRVHDEAYTAGSPLLGPCVWSVDCLLFLMVPAAVFHICAGVVVTRYDID